MVAFAGGVLLAAWLLPLFVQPVFRAEARLALTIPPPRPRLDPDRGVLVPGPRMEPRQRAWVLYQEKERLVGEPLRSRLADEFGVQAAALFPSLRVESLEGGDGSALRLSIESQDPDLAARLLQRLLELAEASAPQVLPEPDPLEEVGQALEAAREALSQTVASMRELESEGSLALLVERTAFSRRERETVVDALARAEAEFQARKASAEALERQVAGLPEMVLIADTQDLAIPPQDLPILEERLRKLRAEEAELLGKFPLDSEPVQDVRRRLQVAESSLERLLTPARTRMVQNPLRTRLEERLLDVQAEIAALEARVAEARRRLETIEEELAGREKRLAELQPRVEALQEERRERNREIARLERLRPVLEERETGGRLLYQVVEPPRKPFFPFRPDRGRILLLGLILALVGTPSLAIVMDMLTSRSGRERRGAGA